MATARIPLCALLLVLIVENVWSGPAFYHDPESSHPLSAVSGLSSRLAAHAQRDDARLPLPTPQELEAIKKVAQILVMLGEQVLGSSQR
ncbi:uncharacterized protein LOC114358164 isoform X2 [Ostrinia furnacalis]|uniref:uncharacterized protein LOC114358164 isoform X2 n=1 Tax=Ostrinia furnacalis TaxID=93504 RepID=UPI00103E0380|nr:uncharacterized protein LOC114358164 isoform X2 [Ostrinia furnacalis]